MSPGQEFGSVVDAHPPFGLPDVGEDKVHQQSLEGEQWTYFSLLFHTGYSLAWTLMTESGRAPVIISSSLCVFSHSAALIQNSYRWSHCFSSAFLKNEHFCYSTITSVESDYKAHLCSVVTSSVVQQWDDGGSWTPTSPFKKRQLCHQKKGLLKNRQGQKNHPSSTGWGNRRHVQANAC